MKSPLLLFTILIAAFITGCGWNEVDPEFREASKEKSRSDILLDFGWKFHRGDTSGAETPGFKDDSWRSVDLPHDWSIEDLPGKDIPVDSLAVGGIDAGYFVGGTGWYRKEFVLPFRLKNKHVQLLFEGVYMNSEVWVNGKSLGEHPYGYTSFRYDISAYLKPGRKNVIAVKVRNEGRNSRWYSGSGIYRHVWLTVYSPVHIDPWRTFVRTMTSDSAAAVVRFSAGVLNGSEIDASGIVQTTITDPAGKIIAQSESHVNTGPAEMKETVTEYIIKKPELWSLESPSLYKAAVDLFVEDREGRRLFVDRSESSFGIRNLTVSPEKGLMLNGKKIVLKGGCMHHDNGPLGAAAYDRAEERRVELMKQSGFNAIRCSHNPPSPAFLDACDRLGMLVIDEAFDMWEMEKNPQDYHNWFREWWKKDVESMVFRDRNHPSVIMWSIGNEIVERGKPEGAALAGELSSYIRSLDSTRFITSAVNSVAPDKDNYFSSLDICGYNYEKDKYLPDHKRMPSRIMFGSESFALEAFDYWMAVRDYPWVIGDFVWTGYDYLGEASIGWLGYPHEGSFYPWSHAYCGDIDICGFKRPQSYYRDAIWNEKKTVSVFVTPPEPTFPLNPGKAEWSKWEWQDVVPSWNWEGHENKTLNVEAYSNCQETELFLNGHSLGKRLTGRDQKYMANWKVNYAPGTLEVKGYENGKVVASAGLRTAGKSEKIKVTADRSVINASGEDLSYVTIELTDADGFRNPAAQNLLHFKVTGPGCVVSAGSSSPMGNESFRKPFRKAWQGRCLVILKSDRKPGEITLDITAEGIQPAKLIVRSI
ncbi:MAG: glycoside hydrolase family 2 TIM barrel-domain containing protein [Bacteroidales bacterium]